MYGDTKCNVKFASLNLLLKYFPPSAARGCAAVITAKLASPHFL